jgi:cytoskeletal protein CcmA (bactofilin family)
MAKSSYQDNPGKMDVYISAESVITGDLQTKSNIKIDGRVNGNVNASGNVSIGGSALVEGNVTGVDVQIAGTVNGNISASGGLLLYGSAKLMGDVKAASMEVEKGALYKGSMVIGEPVKEGAKIVEGTKVIKEPFKSINSNNKDKK